MSVEDKLASGAYTTKLPYVRGDREARRLYNTDQERLRQEFRADLEAEYGLVGHPKAAKLFDMAWEDCHSSGFSEVASHYDRLAELVL